MHVVSCVHEVRETVPAHAKGNTMATYTSIQISRATYTDRADVARIKLLLDCAESDVDRRGVAGVRALVRRALAGEAEAGKPLRATATTDGAIWAGTGADVVKIGTWTQAAL
jgi:hypothetical protein